MSKDQAPVITAPNPAGQGAPIVSDTQFEIWLSAMTPWLRMGSTIRRALTMSALTAHKDVVYEKYQAGGWFADRIDELRAGYGEMLNETTFKLVETINQKVLSGQPLTEIDVNTLKLATKHRTAQPFFVDRQETAQAKEKDFGKVVDAPSIAYITPQDAAPDKPVEQNNATDQSNNQPTPNTVSTDTAPTPGVAQTG